MAKKPEDIDIKIGSEDMVFWRDLIENTERRVQNFSNEVKLQEAVLDMAKEKYEEADIVWNTLLGEDGRKKVMEATKHDKRKTFE